MSAESKFIEAVGGLTDGNRHGRPLNRTAALARLAGKTENEFVSYVVENAPGDRRPDPYDVRSAYRYAANGNTAKGISGIPLGGDGNFSPSRRQSEYDLTPAERAEARRLLLPKAARQFIPVTLRNYATTAFTGTATADIFDETIRMSEDDFLAAAGADIYAKQAAQQLRALFRPGEKVWAGWIIQDEAVRRRLGYRYAKTAFDGKSGIIEAHTLADRIESGIVAKIPTHISLNPVAGQPDANGSRDSAQTIAAYRHLLVEWDGLKETDAEGVPVPTREHIEIVAGLIDYAFETDRIRPLVAVYTGKKSIHFALRVKADDRAAYKRQTDALRDLFASADDKTFRVDTNGWDNGYTHLRLAGAIRPETGRRARLLWSETSLDRSATSKGGIDGL